MLKTKSLGKRLVLIRYKLGSVVCKATQRYAVSCEVTLGEINDGVDRVLSSWSNS